jgi:hypothetical protein
VRPGVETDLHSNEGRKLSHVGSYTPSDSLILRGNVNVFFCRLVCFSVDCGWGVRKDLDCGGVGRSGS